MKKSLIFILLGCLVLMSCNSSQSIEQEQFTPVSTGPDMNEMELYRFYDGEGTPAPDGYELFYLSHYGRHGSRAATSESQTEDFYAAMEWAHKADMLTELGDSLYKDACVVAENAEGMYGFLTQKGVKQHQGIAERAFERYPELLGGKSKIHCISSVYQRCILSMNSFTNTLAAKNPKLDIGIDTGEKYMLMINGESLRDLRAAVNKKLAVLRNDTDTLAQMKKLFKDEAAVRKNIPNYKDFIMSLFMTASMAANLDVEVDMLRYMEPDQFYYCWDRRNRYAYLMTCPSAELGSVRMEGMTDFLKDFIAKADAAVDGKNPHSADFRFGHDFALLAILNYFNLEFLPQGLSIDEIPGNFLASNYASMASNLQVPFYKNAKGEVLVKVLHNEKEQAISGLTPVSGPYYKWDEVRNMLQGYIAA